MDTSWSLTKAGATEILAQIAGNKGGTMKFPKRKTISRVDNGLCALLTCISTRDLVETEQAIDQQKNHRKNTSVP